MRGRTVDDSPKINSFLVQYRKLIGTDDAYDASWCFRTFGVTLIERAECRWRYKC